MYLLTVLTLLLGTWSSGFALPPAPVFYVEGEMEIVCLFDIHRGQRGEECTDLDKTTMEMAFTAWWRWEELNKTSISPSLSTSSTPIGLAVYDLCGSDKMAVEILSSYISSSSLNVTDKTKELGGVISYTGPEPTNVISEILRHLYIPHVQLTADVSTKQESVFRNRINVPLASETRVQAAVDAIDVLNWTYVSVYSLNQTSAISEYNSFLAKLKANRKVCVDEHSVLRTESMSTLNVPLSSSKGVIIFTGDTYTRSMFTDLDKSSQNKILFVGGTELSNVTQLPISDDVVFLVEHFTELHGLSEFISEKQNLPIRTVQTSSLLPEFNCEPNTTSISVSETSEPCRLPSMTSQSLHSVSNAIGAMFNSLVTLLKENCRYNINQCLPISLKELLNYNLKGSLSEEWNPYLELVSPTTSTLNKKKNSTADLSQLHGNVKVQGHLPENVYNSSCVENCLACSVCVARYTSSEQIILQEADIFIVGSFPIYKSSVVNTCKLPNPSGLQAARIFLSAIESFKDRYNDVISLQNITIGGVVLDSCSYLTKPDVRISDIESCMYDYRDAADSAINLPPVRTAAYFNFHESIDHVTMSSFNPKLSASVSKLGIGLQQNIYKRYSEAMIKTLLKINWTYFKVIHSTNAVLKELVAEFINGLNSSELCISEMIEIGPSVDDYLPHSTLSNKEGVGTLLFTTIDDTAKILDSIQTFNNASSKQKIFIFPWNLQALLDIKKPEFLENAILLRPKNWPLTMVNETVDDEIVPWKDDFSEKTNITLNKEMESSIIVGVDLLLSTINAVYRQSCKEQNGICEQFSDFKELKPRLESTFDMLLAGMESPFEIHDFRMVDEKLNTLQIGSILMDGTVNLEISSTNNTKQTVLDVAPSTCAGWCPKCYLCKNGYGSQKDNLYLPGDILITGVLPIHGSGSAPFQCGQITDDSLSNQETEAFMYAIETSQKRYPYLLNNIRVGGFILDDCSSPHKAIQMIGNYESCGIKLNDSDSVSLSPKTNLAYVVQGENYTMDPVYETVKDLNKLAVTTYRSSKNISQVSADSGSVAKSSVIVDLLLRLNWTYVHLITTQSESYIESTDVFMKMASRRGLCVGKILALTRSVDSIVEVTRFLESSNKAVVMMVDMDVLSLFSRTSDMSAIKRPWILDITGDDWNTEELADLRLPSGSLIIDKYGKSNPGFEKFMSDFNIEKAGLNTWWKKYWSMKYGCSLPGVPHSGGPCTFTLKPNEDRPFAVQAAKIIRAVDIALHAIHSRYLSSCPLVNGICANFASYGISSIPSSATKVYFQEGEEKIEFTTEGQLIQKFLIKTYSSAQQYKVGAWRDGVLTLQESFFQYPPASFCSVNCVCENTVRFTNTSSLNQEATPRYLYWTTSGRFTGRLWATVLVAIAATGAFVSLVLTVYVVHKVCNGTLAKRYVGLGILLLIGVMLLFLSVLPFVFTPSEAMCGLRYVMSGCTFAFTFAIILVKLTSLRDYKMIGLGGDVSTLNQYLFVAFVSGVQIAIAVQWWTLRTPLVIKTTTDVSVEFACRFDRAEFVLHHLYVMILIVVCALYAIGVRRETKNMGEARLLLWCCWLCIPVWIAWLIVFFVQEREYSEPTACVAIVSCATLMLTVIFIPKIHMVAKIKYSIAKGANGFHNGYKLDSEFSYERPYSLPGTLTTNYSTMKTHPRSISNFDASMSY